MSVTETHRLQSLPFNYTLEKESQLTEEHDMAKGSDRGRKDLSYKALNANYISPFLFSYRSSLLSHAYIM